jgi:hypothetical protein
VAVAELSYTKVQHHVLLVAGVDYFVGLSYAVDYLHWRAVPVYLWLWPRFDGVELGKELPAFGGGADDELTIDELTTFQRNEFGISLITLVVAGTPVVVGVRDILFCQPGQQTQIGRCL